MIRISIPEGATMRRLPFYLALEEWVAKYLPEGKYYFPWRVAPTVICGRNQDIPAEVNLDYCRDAGIEVVRRKSGGGCVYADLDNLMISYISAAHDDVATAFAEFTGLVAKMLQELGIEAEPTGRNDIVIRGRKVSGNAFYRLPGRYIAHGTMLFSTDMQHMLNAITPAQAKLDSKKVASVQSRITTLREHKPDLSISEFVCHLDRALATGQYQLTAADLDQVCEIEQGYYLPHWIGQARWRKPSSKATQSGREFRIDGVGTLRMELALDAVGNVVDAMVSGDFFPLCDIDQALAALDGLPLDVTELAQALGVEPAIAGLDNEQLAAMLVKSAT